MEEALIVGVGVSLAMLLRALLFFRSLKKPALDGTVTDKYVREEHTRRDNINTETIYTTVIRTDDGKQKTIKEQLLQQSLRKEKIRRYLDELLLAGDIVPEFDTALW